MMIPFYYTYDAIADFASNHPILIFMLAIGGIMYLSVTESSVDPIRESVESIRDLLDSVISVTLPQGVVITPGITLLEEAYMVWFFMRSFMSTFGVCIVCVLNGSLSGVMPTSATMPTWPGYGFHPGVFTGAEGITVPFFTVPALPLFYGYDVYPSSMIHFEFSDFLYVGITDWISGLEEGETGSIVVDHCILNEPSFDHQVNEFLVGIGFPAITSGREFDDSWE